MSEDAPQVARLTRRLVDAGLSIAEVHPDRPEFLHAVLCQVGLPRSRQEGREFVRSAGKASMMITAGKKFDGQRWTPCPLPYGTKPRLALIHLCSEAVRTQSSVIDVGDGIVPFLRDMGLTIGGKTFREFKNQMTYLAACQMEFAYFNGERIYQTSSPPIQSFDAWANPFTGQASFWPDQIELGARFFETLCAHAVPLDPRAVHALQNSSLAMDVYSWLAHRLCRVRAKGGVKLSWRNLKEQFGHEYGSSKDFKKAMRAAIRKALAVYPHADVSEEIGGIRIKSSPPPIRKRSVVTALLNR